MEPIKTPVRTEPGNHMHKSGMTAFIARSHVVGVALLTYLVVAVSASAIETDQDADWVTKDHWPAPDQYFATDTAGVTLSTNIISPPFDFQITPGNYRVIVEYAVLDDRGSIGTANAHPSAGCGYPATITNTEVFDAYITNGGFSLAVPVSVFDNCAEYYGYYDVSITWMARKKCTRCDVCGEGPAVHSIHYKMGLGTDRFGQQAGELALESDLPSPLLSKPEGLKANLGTMVERIDTNSVLRQLRTSQLLADIIVADDFSYRVDFYSETNFNPVKVDGFYNPTGSPFKTIAIQNPDRSTNHNRLTVKEIIDGGTNVFVYTFTTNTGFSTWSLASGSGAELRTEARTRFAAGGGILAETNTILNADDSIAFKQVETYQIFPWDRTNLIQRVVDPEGSRPRTNTWAYYTNTTTDGGGYQQLKQITTPSGYWEKYRYDSSRRMVTNVAQFGNAPITAADSQCRVTTHAYETADDITEVTTVQKLLGQEISRSYRLEFEGGSSNIVCQTAGAEIDATNNLINVTMTYVDGDFQGRTRLTKSPDGMGNVFVYATNESSFTTTVSSGAFDHSGTNIVDGTRTISVVDVAGHSISNASFDIVTGILLSSAMTLESDENGRPTMVQYNDGTKATTTYGCCGVESETDREGITTYYTYDALKRVSTVTRTGITTLTTYDAVGRVHSITRIGTDSSQIVQKVCVYDVAGRLLASTNAMGHATSYSETNDASGNTVRITTNPENGMRVETYSHDGAPISSAGSAIQPYRIEYGVEALGDELESRAYTKTVLLNTDGTDSLEWTKSYTDMVGRNYRTIYSSAYGSPENRYFYNEIGQLQRQVDADGVSSLYQYSSRGIPCYTVLDMNKNGVIDLDGVDRISYSIDDVINDGGIDVRRTRNYVWATNDLNSSNLVSFAEVSTDGLRHWNVVYSDGIGLTNYSETVFEPTNRRRIVKTRSADGAFTLSTNFDGRLASVTVYDASSNQMAQTLFGYDAHGRQNSVTDARNGTSLSFFNGQDQPVAALTPSPDGVEVAQLSTNVLDTMGRVQISIKPDGTRVTNEFYLTGQLKKTSGSRTYPVEYSYDFAGRMKTMKTWQNYSNNVGAAITRWKYDTYRGWLTGKIYAEGSTNEKAGPRYSYTAAGRVESRTWARGLVTLYKYNAAGELNSVTYSDTTSNVSYSYDRRGRQTSIIANGASATLAYNGPGQLVSESYAGGPLDGLIVSNRYDALLRRTSVGVLAGATVISATDYGYDEASRIVSVGDETNSATYSYLANSALVANIRYTNNGALRMMTQKSYDYLNRLTLIASEPSVGSVVRFSYAYNAANQRTAVTNEDASRWVFGYDALGQITSGKKYWADNAPVAGQQFEYAFDDIGNRTASRSGGDTNGANLRESAYTVNLLNQYVDRTVAGYADIVGDATNAATVTVNDTPSSRHSNYFRVELAVTNEGPLWLGVTNLAVLNQGTNSDIKTTNRGDLFVSQTPEHFGFDADGNMTNDGRWIFSWDAENRLTQIESIPGAPSASKRKVTWQFDGLGRRVRQTTYDGSSGTYLVMEDLKFVNDGWRQIAELNATNDILVRAYSWGLDLSGSIGGAGCVGGLLFVANYESLPTTHCAVYDGNGNVMELVDMANGVESAQYEYGPFGEQIRATGPMALANPFRFSTKRANDTTGWVLYETRPYSPSLGRWLTEDPLLEKGGANLYGFVVNSPENYIDPLGAELWGWEAFKKWYDTLKHHNDLADATKEKGEQVILVLSNSYQLNLTLEQAGYERNFPTPINTFDSIYWYDNRSGLGWLGNSNSQCRMIWKGLDEAGGIGENATRLTIPNAYLMADKIDSSLSWKDKILGYYHSLFTSNPQQPPVIIVSYPTNGDNVYYMGPTIPPGYSTNVPSTNPPAPNTPVPNPPMTTNPNLINTNGPQLNPNSNGYNPYGID